MTDEWMPSPNALESVSSDVELLRSFSSWVVEESEPEILWAEYLHGPGSSLDTPPWGLFHCKAGPASATVPYPVIRTWPVMLPAVIRLLAGTWQPTLLCLAFWWAAAETQFPVSASSRASS